MGIARQPCEGICLPSSTGHDTHGVFFPTGTDEQCFQFHFNVPEDQADHNNWGTLSQAVTASECEQLTQRLRAEGWDQRYLEPFQHVVSALRIGFCLLEPALEQFVYWDNSVVLLGDAAHPPVPYLGQGGAMGLEDAGVLCLLLQHYCCQDSSGVFDMQHLPAALKLYQEMRIPRTSAMLANAKLMGHSQAVRASGIGNRRAAKETMIQRQVFFHETMPLLFPGANYNYQKQVAAAIEKAGLEPVPEAPTEVSESSGD
jgi:salicylate hydroxylase